MIGLGSWKDKFEEASLDSVTAAIMAISAAVVFVLLGIVLLIAVIRA